VSHLFRKSICLIILTMVLLANPVHALAIPSLPSSFYGTVKLNNANVLDGTLVQAFDGNIMIAQGYSQIYQGDSVYSLDIPSDNTDTPAVDGGHEGDIIIFKVGGILTNESGIWHSATNVQLNLTVSSASTPKAPQSTPTEMPTQTQIVIVRQPSKTPTLTLVASLSPTKISILPTATFTSAPINSTLPSNLPVQQPYVPVEPTDNKVLYLAIPISITLILLLGTGFILFMRSRNK
jgi:hypothetical protein